MCHNIPPISCRKIDRLETKQISYAALRSARSHKGTIPYWGITVYIGKASLQLNIQQWQHNILATFSKTPVILWHKGLTFERTNNVHWPHGGVSKGVWRWGESEIIYLSLHCHHQNDFCIKMGSSHFNVLVGSDGQSHNTVSINHNRFEEKGEPKRYRTEVLPLTRLTPYR